MFKVLVIIGLKIIYGGIVIECENSFVINGIVVYLNGMKYFCFKCWMVVFVIVVD